MPVQYQSPSKIAIVGLEIKIDLVAQYNPKELQFEKSVTWTAKPTSKQDVPGLEFTSGASRNLSMELLFDTYETGEDVSKKYVSKLMQLISVMNADGIEQEKRPSLVQVIWYDKAHTTFQGVLQSVSTKYTMFSPSGIPVRATCSVKLVEAMNAIDKNKRKVPLGGGSW